MTLRERTALSLLGAGSAAGVAAGWAWAGPRGALTVFAGLALGAGVLLGTDPAPADTAPLLADDGHTNR